LALHEGEPLRALSNPTPDLDLSLRVVIVVRQVFVEIDLRDGSVLLGDTGEHLVSIPRAAGHFQSARPRCGSSICEIDDGHDCRPKRGGKTGPRSHDFREIQVPDKSL
jgi:hypothetical protein